MSRRLDESQRRQIHDLHTRGESLRAIGDAVGVSRTTVSRVLAQPPAPAPDSRAGLVSALVALAVELDSCGSLAAAAHAATCKAAAAALASPPPGDELPEIAFDESAPALDVARSLVQAQRIAHAEALRRGDDRAAQHAARTIQGALSALARLEKAASAESDMVQFPRSVMVAAAQSYRERVALVLQQPLACAHCGAVLRASMAGVALDPAGDGVLAAK